MAGSKKLTFALGALAVVVAGAWFGGNYYAKTQVEKKLDAYLVENGLQENVTWGSLDASILGTATLRDVRFTQKDQPTQYFTIKNLTVHQLQVDGAKQQYDFEFAGLADQSGNSPFLAILKDHASELGYEKLPLLDGRIKGMQDEQQDSVDTEVFLKQPELGNLKVVLKMNQVAELIKISRTPYDKVQDNALAFVSALSPLTIRELGMTFNDAGVMPRVVRVQQGVSPVEGKPSPQQLQAFEARMAKSEKNCLEQAPAQGIAEGEAISICKAVGRFMKNEADSLSVSVKPTPPLHVMSFVMQAQMGNSAAMTKAIRQLNVKISN